MKHFFCSVYRHVKEKMVKYVFAHITLSEI